MRVSLTQKAWGRSTTDPSRSSLLAHAQRSTKTLGEISSPQVRVALKHAQLAVPRDRGDFDDVKAFLEHPRHRLMPKVVHVQILEPHSPGRKV